MTSGNAQAQNGDIEASDQDSAVTINTDKQTYAVNETITITGTVPRTEVKDNQTRQDQFSNDVVILEFGNFADGHSYFIDEAHLSSDGSYLYQINGQNFRTHTVSQTVRALYYCNTPAETSFNFTNNYVRPIPGNATWQTIPVNLAGKTYDVEYLIVGGTVESMTADTALATMTVGLNTQSDGTLILELSDAFQIVWHFPIAFADGIDVEPQLLFLSDHFSAIQIDFERGTEEIEVVGYFSDEKPSLSLPKYQQYPKSYHTRAYANVAGQEFFMPVQVNGADSCVYSFSQREKKFHIELEGKGSQDGSVALYMPIILFSGNFTIFEDHEQQQITHIQEQPAIIIVNGENMAVSVIQHRYNWSNPNEMDTIALDLYATRVLPEFSPLLIGGILAVSILAILIATRNKKHGLAI
jgi:hypothetical protein